MWVRGIGIAAATLTADMPSTGIRHRSSDIPAAPPAILPR
ncbi:Uncharacterised protein [Mycobacteroides abscessus subsp. abscessus]|nr:Uncharacterised protein [Mycobacteroides abscessus subsp. abscessus]